MAFWFSHGISHCHFDMCLQTPILWSHGIADRTVLFEAGQAGPPFLEKIGVSCEFKVKYSQVNYFKNPLI